MKKEENAENTVETFRVPRMEVGESMKLTRIGDNYVVSELNEYQNGFSNNYVEQATYDMDKLNHVYDKYMESENNSYITTTDEISELAKNTQTDINKIDKVNSIIKYYINKEDLIGRVTEAIENNVNTKYKIIYPEVDLKRKKDIKAFDELKTLIERFNEQIGIGQIIQDAVVSTYIEGNYLCSLLGDNIDNGYCVKNYPLKVGEITPIKVDNDPVISINVQTIKNQLNKIKSKYKNLKSNKLIDVDSIIEQEIKRDYPQEVYDAFVTGDKIAFIDPKTSGVVRINNLKKLYGLSPIFKALSSQLMLETLDKVDRKNLIGKSKKLVVQLTNKELMGKEYNNPMQINPIGYSHTSLVGSMANETVIYTAMPYVEDVKILEPKQDVTDPNVTATYKNRILSALGISYLADSKTGQNSAKMNYEDLLKTVNKISKQLNPIFNKWYKKVCEDNGFPVELAPKIEIQSTKMMDLDSLMKIVECYFGKVSLSYETIIETLGLDYKDELRKRKEENDNNISQVFSPYGTSYTTSNKDIVENEDTNKNGSKKSEDDDKREYDDQRQQQLV